MNRVSVRNANNPMPTGHGEASSTLLYLQLVFNVNAPLCAKSVLVLTIVPPSCQSTIIHNTMNGENRPLVTDEPVEFEKWPVEVKDLMKITHGYVIIEL